MYSVNEIKNKVFQGDSLQVLKDFPGNSIDLVVTSPPYFNLRNYQHKDQIGTENTPQDYVKNLINIFRECKRVLKRTGSIWVNISDSYASGGGKAVECSFVRNSETRKNDHFSPDNPAKAKLRSTMGKSLLGIPERFVIAMQDELGLIRRNTIIWFKPSCMPSSAMDRFTIDFEYFYFFTKEQDYYFETQYEPMKTFYSNLEYKGTAQKDYKGNEVQDPSDTKRRILEGYKAKIKFGGNKYPSNQDSVTNDTYSGKEWIPNEDLMRIKRTVWSINTGNSTEKHFACFPEELIEIPIKACSQKKNSIVLDPFAGSGTTLLKARKMERSFVGVELKNKIK